MAASIEGMKVRGKIFPAERALPAPTDAIDLYHEQQWSREQATHLQPVFCHTALAIARYKVLFDNLSIRSFDVPLPADNNLGYGARFVGRA